MKQLEIFYQDKCPYCKKALKYIQELQEENDTYRLIVPKLTNEEIKIDYADLFDYFYVPAFFIDGKKVHEGIVTKDEIRSILDKVLE